jgi:FkbM family methyltransferase
MAGCPADCAADTDREGRAMDCKRVANERRSPEIQARASECVKFLECYENAFDYDFNSNGERFILEAMAKQQFCCIFDVGAHVGSWALMAHQSFPSATIHCFEIMKPIYETLKERTKGIPNIIVNDLGLSDRAGEMTLKYYPTASDLTSQIDYPHPCAYTLATGSAIRGDSYIQEHGITHVDFMKMDVEGAEDRVLRGLEKAIRCRTIDVIQFEYGRVNILTKFLLYDFYALFRANGYWVGKIYPNYVEFREYSFAHEDFLGPNYLAVREDRPDLISLVK